MSQTKAEKLEKQEGKPVLCENCNRLKVFDSNQWVQTFKGEVVCPACREKVINAGRGAVSI